ncbi:hypothetical protein EDD85DRAFT_798471 [Armillaria nabsnona]|nr:hypothetical protein EDD85DRAFT_798471 [Armillaria nabsnona]
MSEGMAGLWDREEHACVMERKGMGGEREGRDPKLKANPSASPSTILHTMSGNHSSISPLEDVQGVTQTNLGGVFACSKNVIQAFQANQVDEKGMRGDCLREHYDQRVLIWEARVEGVVAESAERIWQAEHTCVPSRERRNDPEWEQNEDVRLSPDGIAESYLHLIKQPRSAWTWELDLRPAHEKW